jgi:hypothetical protein
MKFLVVANFCSKGSGNVTLANASNQVATIAASNTGNLTYVDADNFVIGTVDSVSGINVSGTVTLTATAGSINSASDDAVADIVGTTITLTAGSGGIGTGSVLDVTASTSLSADTDAGDDAAITIDSIGDVAIALIDAGAGAVTLDSTGDIDGATDDATADLIGGTVSLTAAVGGIGQGTILDVTAATSLSADTDAGDDGAISIDSIGNLTVALVDAGAGAVTLDSTGDIDGGTDDATADVVGGAVSLISAAGGIGQNTILDVTAATSLSADTDAGDDAAITIDSIGDVAIALIDAGAGAVTLDSTGDIDGGTDDATADLIGGTVSLTAAVGGIGQNTILDVTAATSLSADTDAGDDGAISIDSIGNLTVALVDAGAGAVTLDSTGDIDGGSDDATADVVGGAVSLIAAVGGIGQNTILDVTAATSLSADTDAGDDAAITIDSIGDVAIALIDAGAGAVTLDSTGDIDGATDDATADLIGGTVSLTAAVGGIGQGTILDVTAATSLSADTDAGDDGAISIDSIGNLTVALVDAGAGAVTLDSTGDIDGGTDDATEDLIGGTVSLTAAVGGIGQNTILDVTAATSLSADTDAGDDGAISIDSIGNLTVALVDAGAGAVTLDSTGDIDGGTDDATADLIGGAVSLTAAVGGIGQNTILDVTAATSLSADTDAGDDGAISIDSIGNLTVALVDAGAGAVTLDSTGDIDGGTDDATADVVGGAVSLIAAAGGIGQNTILDVTAATSLSADTDAGDDAAITIDSIGDVAIALIDAGAGAVTLDSTGDIDGATDDATADLIGGTVSLTAAVGGIGQGTILDVTAATSLSADTDAGDDGAISIDSIGNLTVALVDAGAGAVTLDSTGDIDGGTDDATADLIGGAVSLTAAVGGIGQNTILDVTAATSLSADTDAGDDAAISIDSIGNLTVALVDAGAGAVTLDSTGDIDGGSDDATADVVGGAVSLTSAVGGIGQNTILDVTAATSLSADTDAGDDAAITIDSIGDVAIALIDAGAGAVTLDSTGDIDGGTDDATADLIGGTVSLTAAVGGIGQGTILDVTAATSLSADTDAGDDGAISIDSIGNLTVALVDAGAGAVTLDSTGDIDGGTDDATADLIGGAVSLTAATGGIGQNTILDVTAATSLSADTDAGDDAAISIDSIGNLTVALVDAGAGAVTLDSTGDIDGGSDDATADVVGGAVSLIAAVGGIGQNTILDVTAATSLSADTDAGDDAAITIDSIGDVAIALIDAGAGAVTLDSTGDIDGGTDDATADLIGGTVSLTAAVGGIGQGTILDVTAATSLSADTDAGDDGAISIDSIGNLTVALVDAGAGAVTLDSTGDIDGGTDDATADLIGGAVSLTAAVGGIGQNTILDCHCSNFLER